MACPYRILSESQVSAAETGLGQTCHVTMGFNTFVQQRDAIREFLQSPQAHGKAYFHTSYRLSETERAPWLRPITHVWLTDETTDVYFKLRFG